MASINLSLRAISEWINDMATVATGAIAISLESSFLKDTLKDLCKLSGVAGALFSLGARIIPNPTPEQRIASELHKAFLLAFDEELENQGEYISMNSWKSYVQGSLDRTATKKLASSFTWLSIFGSRGRKPSRNWPVIAALADVASAWIIEAIDSDELAQKHKQHTCDTVRSNVAERLIEQAERILSDTDIKIALEQAKAQVCSHSFYYLAQELSTLSAHWLFNEIPQNAVYISPILEISNTPNEITNISRAVSKPQNSNFEDLYNIIIKSHPMLLIIRGDMGVGKSCLMRMLASKLSLRHVNCQQEPAVVFINWRDIYNSEDMYQAISDIIYSAYGMPFTDLQKHQNIIFMIDGFDEMRSHKDTFIAACFDKILKLGCNNCSIILSMRSSCITPSLEVTWHNKDAIVAHIQRFTSEDVEKWAHKWRRYTGMEGLTGEWFNSVASPMRSTRVDVTYNPLLLYMLAKYVFPRVQFRENITKTEVFRLFVDETIEGKCRASRDRFPLGFDKQEYRLLLQEIANIASWPRYFPYCPADVLKEEIGAAYIQKLQFEDVRTAFVLHFFEPNNIMTSKFEFYPEGFRHYLLAEWCARTQSEVISNGEFSTHIPDGNRAESINKLAQVSLIDDERQLLNEMYEDLGSLAFARDAALVDRLRALGLQINQEDSIDIINRLFKYVRQYSEHPEAHPWEDNKNIGCKMSRPLPRDFNHLRLLVNYWDQCLIAAFALYRGMNSECASDTFFKSDAYFLSRYLAARKTISEDSTNYKMNISVVCFKKIQLDHAMLRGWNIYKCNLSSASLRMADLMEADISSAVLDKANLQGANLLGSLLDNATMRDAMLTYSNLDSVRARNVNMKGAVLKAAHITNSDLSNAILVNADLSGSNLTASNFSNADLTGANMSDANITDADFSNCRINEHQLKAAYGKPRRIPGR